MDNNTNTTQPPSSILKIMILERRNTILYHIEEYFRRKHTNAGTPTHYILAGVQTLFLELQPTIRPKMKESLYKQLSQDVFSNDIGKVLSGFRVLDSMLYEIGVTKLDDQRKLK